LSRIRTESFGFLLGIGAKAKAESVAAWLAVHPQHPAAPRQGAGGSAVPVPPGPAAASVGSLPLAAQRLLELQETPT